MDNAPLMSAQVHPSVGGRPRFLGAATAAGAWITWSIGDTKPGFPGGCGQDLPGKAPWDGDATRIRAGWSGAPPAANTGTDSIPDD